MWVPVVAAGLCGLLAVGLVQLWRGRLTATGGHDQLVTDARFRTPGGPLDRDTAANLAIVALELLALVLAAVLTGYLVVETALAPSLKALFAGTYGVAAVLIARAAYVRLGLPVPGRTAVDDPETLADLTDSLVACLGEPTAAEFESLYDAMTTVRGDGPGPDVVTVALVAAARADMDVATVEYWAATNGIASPATVANRRDELAAAGVLKADCFELARPEFADAPAPDVASMTTTLLS
ncbi:transcriptional regulator TbsP domain-containing protein [Haloarchaeobius iranensis]|uniref:Transcriptional regulator TbsP-like C-terminal domain-containing protein n=1 Tax=Haloarchaeobius iranensis TaxID=996166 RepID=A0A1G9ZVY3_9EURY|nr:DUF5821 family protein [Haloarchaeobius iranensis]SDN25782.1 hypothetical protein SAMN05192554_12318 [Haloarchaeobius iranensis]